jgi:hypothetical protein
MPLGQLRQLSQPIQAVVILYGVITPMPGLDLIRDVPQRLEAHAKKTISLNLLALDVSGAGTNWRAETESQAIAEKPQTLPARRGRFESF